MVIKKLLKKLYKNLIVIGKPLSMHVEAIYIDEYWKGIKELVLTNPKKIKTFFVMTPANYNYFKYAFNVHLEKTVISKKMKERYLWLLKHGQKVQIHIHSDFLMRLSFEELEKLFREGINWFKKNLGYSPVEFVPGCWTHNKDTLTLLKKYNIRMAKFTDYRFIHDYDLVKPKFEVK
jgi:hypothetical protein